MTEAIDLISVGCAHWTPERLQTFRLPVLASMCWCWKKDLCCQNHWPALWRNWAKIHQNIPHLHGIPYSYRWMWVTPALALCWRVICSVSKWVVFCNVNNALNVSTISSVADLSSCHNCLQQSGLKGYEAKYSEISMCDLYQNPDSRPRKGHAYWPALTTGCCRVWLNHKKRFAHGTELLILHSIPATQQVANLMGCPPVDVSSCTHREQCKLAGNSMHGACVGLMCAAALSFAHKKGWQADLLTILIYAR